MTSPEYGHSEQQTPVQRARIAIGEVRNMTGNTEVIDTIIRAVIDDIGTDAQALYEQRVVVELEIARMIANGSSINGDFVAAVFRELQTATRRHKEVRIRIERPLENGIKSEEVVTASGELLVAYPIIDDTLPDLIIQMSIDGPEKSMLFTVGEVSYIKDIDWV